MHLDKRLMAVADMVPEGLLLADIGTDHAYLPVWLLLRGRIKGAIAADVAAGPCRMAQATVRAHQLEGRIEVRQGDGLKVLKPGEAGCIVLAGMGAGTIIKILEASLGLAETADVLVLQPMTGAAALRLWLFEHGWKLKDEELAEEAGHLYDILSAVRGEAKSCTPAECAVGPVLLGKGHPLLALKIEQQLAACRRLLEGMGKSPAAQAGGRFEQIRRLQLQLEVLKDEKIGCGR